MEKNLSMNFCKSLILPYLRSIRRPTKNTDVFVTAVLLSIGYPSDDWMEVKSACEKGIGDKRWRLDKEVLMNVASGGNATFELLKVSSLWSHFPPNVFSKLFPMAMKRYKNDESRLRILADSLFKFVSYNPVLANKYHPAINFLLRSNVQNVRGLGTMTAAFLRFPSNLNLRLMFAGLSHSEFFVRQCSTNAFATMFWYHKKLPDRVLSYLKSLEFEQRLKALTSDKELKGNAMEVLRSYRKIVSRSSS